jgi:hypothetical protein
MLSWEEIGEKAWRYSEDDWILELKMDDSEAILEIYLSTSFVKTAKWGPGVVQRDRSDDWCKKQAHIIFEQEKKKKA